MDKTIDEAKARPDVGCTELLDDFKILYGVLCDAPELNPSNVDHDDACALNTAMLEAFGLCRSILNRIKSNAAVSGGGTPYTARACSALALAKQFHAAYERLAPAFGYKTRPETRAFDPDSANGRLMVAVCQEIIEQNATLSGNGKQEGDQ